VIRGCPPGNLLTLNETGFLAITVIISSGRMVEEKKNQVFEIPNRLFDAPSR
jgi:hypothetical protein